ncbi:hypothetical protein PR202_ga07584 [Eleusine coracana subsp. coracana]|uniref:Glycine cleavage system H protein n=1 Tax=Eleusine coracana subsp. coracana TaxID=191504 RepID=A0AAV5BXX8_ELECO|nr:hypothetical protein PR202_ga07584 [Eleusine coracana subsp. coracana]
MALRLWASSAANALKISGTGARAAAPAYTISRYFATVLDGLKYTSTHEWVKHEGDVATVGITDHAQGHLGEVVFMELPDTGAKINSSPYEEGWMIKVKPSSPTELDGLLDAAKYTKHCEEEDAH